MYRQGLAELNERLAMIQGAISRDEQLARQEQALGVEVTRLAERVADLERAAAREKRDVERLENGGIGAFLVGLFGDREEKLSKERQEYAAAALKLDLARSELVISEETASAVAAERQRLAFARDEYPRVLAEKESWLAENGGPFGEELFAMAEESGRMRAIVTEIDEALVHGHEAQAHLYQVHKSLDSAAGWGLFDMLGGGLVATLVKHSRIGDAKMHLPAAQASLQKFQRELQDVGEALEAEVEVGNLATFGDFFFDGLIFDWVVQSRIRRSRESVGEVLGRVQSAVVDLEKKRGQVIERMEHLDHERRRRIEKF